MAGTDQANAADGAREIAHSSSELDKAQVICVMGEVFPLLGAIFRNRVLMKRFFSGGPGVGKGTQCQRLVADLGVSHLSVGDLLREGAGKVLAKEGIDIVGYMRDGKLVPHRIVQNILEDGLASSVREGKTHILLDGFPRSMDQTRLFEAGVSLLYLSKGCNNGVESKELTRT